MTTYENAQRWVAQCEDDANSCTPCKNNGGRTYRNRQAAYRDYPGGSGYVKCEGQANCRCSVVKRGREGNSMNKALIERVRAAAAAVSSRKLTEPVRNCSECRDAPAEPFRSALGASGQGGAIYLYDAIGGWDGIQALDVVNALAGLSGPLDVHINSTGGVIFEGAAIFNALKNYPGTKTAYIDGVAASAASFIAMACDEIVTEKNATMMVHDGSGLCWGNADDMRDTADLLDLLSDSIAETYAARTGGTVAQWRDIMRGGDAWYNATQMVAAKLADRINGVAPDPETAPEEPAEPAEPADALAANARLDMAWFNLEATVAAPAAPAEPPLDLEAMRAALIGAFV